MLSKRTKLTMWVMLGGALLAASCAVQPPKSDEMPVPTTQTSDIPMGPVLAGLVVAGRNASGMASELGSMVVTEQIDAMRALGTDPLKKLVTPRVVSTTVMLFFLTILGDLMGLIGGGFVAAIILGLDAHEYWSNAWQTLVFSDVFMGLAKPIVFGFLVATIGCYYGLSTKGGTQGVGRATTEAVVASMILIIAVDVFVTRFLMIVLGS